MPSPNAGSIAIVDVTDESAFALIPPCADPGFDHRSCDYWEDADRGSKAIRLDNDRKATLYAHFYLGLVYLEREMYEDAQTFFRKTLQLGPKLIEAYFELGRALWFDGQRDAAMDVWRDGHRTNKFNPWGKRCEEMLKHVEGGGSLSRSRATA